MIALVSAVIALGIASGLRLRPVLIWNVTASVPRGLYWVDHNAPRLNDLVATHLPPKARALADQRHYLPANVPLIKPVAALSGHSICRQDRRIFIDEKPVALALNHDLQGRALPSWSGCQKLTSNQIFLLNPAVPESFDGRYFGPIPAQLVVGRAVPILMIDKVKTKSAPLTPDP